MKIIYEFENPLYEDKEELEIFSNAQVMYNALSFLAIYMRSLNKGTVKDDRKKILKNINRMLIDSKFYEI